MSQEAATPDGELVEGAIQAAGDCVEEGLRATAAALAAESFEGKPSVANAICRLAEAVIPYVAAPGVDATGGHVSSLTEAVMGHTAAMVQIAEALNNVAGAIREHD